MGTKLKFWERQRMRAQCPKMELRSRRGCFWRTVRDIPSWDGGTRGGHSLPLPLHPWEDQTYQVSLPKLLLRLRCLIEGCLGGASNRYNIQVHFAHRHVRDTIVILEEGKWPYTCFPKYDMIMPHKAQNVWHLVNKCFHQGEERKLHRLVEEEARAVTTTVITAYGTPLAPVTSFK